MTVAHQEPQAGAVSSARRARGQVILCQGCCCGRTDRGFPEVPVDRIKAAWKSGRLNRMIQLTVSGSVKQETHLVTSPRSTFQVPIIGFSALLQLVEWCHVRRQRRQQGGSSCVDPEPPLSPPRPIGRARLLVPRQFWLTLTVESRERILGTLSRIVTQQLTAPPAIREVTNERN